MKSSNARYCKISRPNLKNGLVDCEKMSDLTLTCVDGLPCNRASNIAEVCKNVHPYRTYDLILEWILYISMCTYLGPPGLVLYGGFLHRHHLTELVHEN